MSAKSEATKETEEDVSVDAKEQDTTHVETHKKTEAKDDEAAQSESEYTPKQSIDTLSFSNTSTVGESTSSTPLRSKNTDSSMEAPSEGAEGSDAKEPSVSKSVTSEMRAAANAMDESEKRSLLRDSWTPMNDDFRWFWEKFSGRFFRELSIDEERVEMLHETEQSGTVVYVLRSKSYLNYLIYNYLFLANKLPLSTYAQGLYWLPWQKYSRQFRVFGSWLGRLFGFGGRGADELFRGLVRHGETTVIFLKKPVTLLTYFRRGLYWFQNRVRSTFGLPLAPGGRQVDHIEELVRVQRQQEEPIFLCPQVLIWDPVAASTRKTFWDVVFGEKEFPGVIRELYLFWRNRSKSQVRGGEPIHLKEIIASSPTKLTDADIARKLRWEMLDRFAKETRIVTGPKLRPASDMKNRVLGANRVKAAIRAEAEEKGASIESVRRRAHKIVERMAADYSMPISRRFDWMLSRFWNQMYQIRDTDVPGLGGMEVDQEGVLRLREAAKEAPLLLLPSHKSHIDYLVLSQVFLHYGMVPPHIAAGDNLNIPVLGYLFKKCGAFFIRRSFKGDQLYKEIFVEYLHRLFREGYTIEFFIEGGRSRTGKLRNPKMGMLSMIVDGILDKRIRDFHLAPISIGYDRIIEGESYTRELLGKAKEKESLKGLLKSWNLLRVNFGRVHLNFADPVSARRWIDRFTEEERLIKPEYDPVHNEEDRRHLVKAMAYRVVHEINQASAIMPSALVAALLMTNSKRGIRHEQLVEKVEWLRKEITDRGGKVAAFDNTSAVVQRTVTFLSKLIKQPQHLLEPVYRPRDQRRLELSYYRNQVGHLFLAEGVVICALYGFRQMRASDAGVLEDELLQSVQFLSRLLKLEFIFSPAHEIEVNFQETLEWMLSRGALTRSEGRIKVTAGNEKMFSFLQALYGPFVDSYWVASVGFLALWGDGEAIEEKKLIEKMQQIADTLYHEGYLRYSDSVSMESLKNALALYKSMRVIESISAEEWAERKGIRKRRLGRSRYIGLLEEYQQDKEHLLQLIRRVGKYSSCLKFSDVIERMQSLLITTESAQISAKGGDNAK